MMILVGANYRRDHVIAYGNKTYDSFTSSTQENGLRVLNYEMPEMDNSEENLIPLKNSDVEADIIIRDIQNKVKTGYLVFGKLENNEWGLRPAKFSDFYNPRFSFITF